MTVGSSAFAAVIQHETLNSRVSAKWEFSELTLPAIT